MERKSIHFVVKSDLMSSFFEQNFPSPSAPPIDAVDQLAIEHDECCICMNPLCESSICFLCNNNNKRTCRHYFHKDCATSLAGANNKRCPICREPFQKTKDVTDPRKDPNQFFRDIDVDGNGSLSYAEITDGFKATLPLDFRSIEGSIDNFFTRWDTDKSGSISLSEFTQRDGPMSYVNQAFLPKSIKLSPPLLTNTKKEWFQYWDEDQSNSLDKSEVTRALIKTFRHHSRPDIANEIRSTLNNVWFLFDTDSSGTIEMNEFIQEDNLADTIIATCRSV